MAGAKFEYDESGGTSFYFLLSFLALILVPCTYYFWPFSKEEDEDSGKGNNCLCIPCMKKRGRSKQQNKKTSSKTIRIVLLLLGWIAFAALVYKVSTIEREGTMFDPYEVLSLDKSASMSQIKRAYRKLSLQYHPDKPTGDHAMFMKIAKSYQALTDEDARKNWEEFGSPDGPQAASFGIALPSWIVDKDNSLFVLGAYLFAFVIVLPVCVGTWWYRSIRYTSDEILVDTTRLYYHFLMQASLFPIKRATTVLSGSMEFEPSLNKKVAIRPSDNNELPELIRKLPDVVVEGKQMPFNLAYSVKARLLIGAHLSRLELPPNTLEIDKNRIIGYCPRLLQEMISCMSQVMSYLHQTQQKGHRGPTLEAMENCMRLCAMLVQGVKDYHNPLLQLPHFTADHLRFMRSKKRVIRNLLQLAELPEKDRREMLRHFDGQEYCNIVNVLSALPYVTLDSIAEVKDDEDPSCITAGSLITVTTQLKRSTIGEHYKLLSVEELVAAYESNSGHPNASSVSTGGRHSAAAAADFGSEAANFDADGDDPLAIEDEPEEDGKPAKVNQWVKKKDKKPAKKPKQQSKGDRRKKMKELAQQQQKQKEEEEEQQLALARQAEDDDDEDDSSGSEGEEDTGTSEPPSPRAANNLVARRRKGGSAAAAAGKRRDSESGSEGDDMSGGESDEDGHGNSDEDEEEEWKLLQKERGDELRLDALKKLSPEVHAPFFPDKKHEKWWLYVCDRRKKEIISPPQLLSTLSGTEEVKTALPAPPKPCVLHYTVVLRSDSYLDAEYCYSLKIDVHEAKEMSTAQAQWKDLEQEEEDDEDLMQMSSGEDMSSDYDD
ncbi:translocation protein SEC63 homolog [Sycon ciliatum]|uniref:translocation protein SEC63 homolog n=1 Tax=Sycon ciliatum TaxID=27933 RepID=UPI0020A99714|eukprot:scpid4647/ scgid32188/ Translocation protein SEC63 homolog